MMEERVHINETVAKFLNEIAGQLAVFLEKILPPLIDDWWNKAVINSLSFQQKRRIEQHHITTIGGLDLAGLLRVLDQNWHHISTNLDLKSEARHYVKEMQTVHNRWAHATSEGFPLDDVYRDLDTLQRFAAIIGTEDTFIQEVQSSKLTLLAREAELCTNADVIIPKPSQTTN